MRELTSIGVDHCAIEVDYERYIVTLGTGERSYGSDGGVLAFAYRYEDVKTAWRLADYCEFCELYEPLGESDPEWRAVAIACALRGWRLTQAGGCSPALTDEEWREVRLG